MDKSKGGFCKSVSEKAGLLLANDEGGSIPMPTPTPTPTPMPRGISEQTGVCIPPPLRACVLVHCRSRAWTTDPPLDADKGEKNACASRATIWIGH